MSQKYPPENSNLPRPTFRRSFVDDILGTLHPEDEVTRDDDERLRRADDVDEGLDDDDFFLPPESPDPPWP